MTDSRLSIFKIPLTSLRVPSLLPEGLDGKDDRYQPENNTAKCPAALPKGTLEAARAEQPEER
jgi:hypothetical protein